MPGSEKQENPKRTSHACCANVLTSTRAIQTDLHITSKGSWFVYNDHYQPKINHADGDSFENCLKSRFSGCLNEKDDMIPTTVVQSISLQPTPIQYPPTDTKSMNSKIIILHPNERISLQPNSASPRPNTLRVGQEQPAQNHTSTTVIDGQPLQPALLQPHNLQQPEVVVTTETSSPYSTYFDVDPHNRSSQLVTTSVQVGPELTGPCPIPLVARRSDIFLECSSSTCNNCDTDLKKRTHSMPALALEVPGKRQHLLHTATDHCRPVDHDRRNGRRTIHRQFSTDCNDGNSMSATVATATTAATADRRHEEQEMATVNRDNPVQEKQHLLHPLKGLENNNSGMSIR